MKTVHFVNAALGASSATDLRRYHCLARYLPRPYLRAVVASSPMYRMVERRFVV